MSASTHSLPDYAAAVGELLASLREEAQLLSSIDQHLVATWWAERYPLDTVLRTIHDVGHRLLARKHPPRGLPLKSLAKQVEKAGAAARNRAEASGGAPRDAAEGGRLLTLAEAALDAAAREEAPGSARGEALEAARRTLTSAGLDDPAPYATLLLVARCYYDALLAALSPARRSDLVRRVLGAGADVDRSGVASAVDELLRRALRDEDPLLDLDTLLGDRRS